MEWDTQDIIFGVLIEATISTISPLAGLLADVKYGRYNILKASTYFMAIFEFTTLLFFIVALRIVNSIDYTYYLMITLIIVSSICYYLGRVFFNTNIIQFGTDQLRDLPTSRSDCYIHLVLFVEQLAKLLVYASKSLASGKIYLNSHYHSVYISTANAVIYETWFAVPVVLSIIVIFLVEKYSAAFMLEHIRGNPYKLVINVITFAVKHKKPLRKSAFTYCEDERPSRIDYGKQRFGGPFTTEQVEDVKVFIRMTKILTILSPIFLLNLSSRIILYKDFTYSNGLRGNAIIRTLLDSGVLSPLIIVICIPLFLLLKKPHFYLNLFKRMGLGLLIVTVLFLIYILCGIFAKDDDSYVFKDTCLGFSNNSRIHQWKVIKIPIVFLPILQQILTALSQMFFSIAVWHFICCQSPQYMKGLLFGFYLFIKGAISLLSSCLLYLCLNSWKRFKFGCEFDFYILHFLIGLASLLPFVFVARKYKYIEREMTYVIFISMLKITILAINDIVIECHNYNICP